LSKYNFDEKVELMGRFVKVRTFEDTHMTPIYFSWVNDPLKNRFLETRYQLQDISTCLSYRKELWSRLGCDLLAIEDLITQEHLGNISITEMNFQTGVSNFGILVGDSESSVGKIAAAEGCVLVIDYLFSFNDIYFIRNNVHERNFKSVRLVEGLGFSRIGEDINNVDGSIIHFELKSSDWKSREGLIR
jgi:RimJ/RimL family protein N-acetyltransferase